MTVDELARMAESLSDPELDELVARGRRSEDKVRIEAAKKLEAKIEAVLPEDTGPAPAPFGFATDAFAEAARGFVHMPVIRAACITYIELWRGVPLITVLFMASVMFENFSRRMPAMRRCSSTSAWGSSSCSARARSSFTRSGNRFVAS